MPLSPEMAGWLRTQGHEAIHVAEIGMSQSPDAEILRVAANEARVVITADLDFPRLLAMLGADGPGLILLRGGNYSEAESFECVRRVLTAIPAHELNRSIVVVDNKRIRRRWLPI